MVPFRRNLFRRFIQDLFVDPLLQALEPGLERAHPADRLVHVVPGVQPAQRRVRKRPLARVEAEALINHQRLVPRPAQLQKEDGLAAVRVASPLVEHQHAGKVGKVFHFAQLVVGQEIVDGHLRGVSRVPRAELQPRPARRAPHPQLDHQLAGVGDQLLADLDDRRRRGGQAEPRPQPSPEQFVGQNAHVLRVVLKLDHVIEAIRTPHQMGLRTPHACGEYVRAPAALGRMLATRQLRSKQIVPRPGTPRPILAPGRYRAPPAAHPDTVILICLSRSRSIAFLTGCYNLFEV